MTVKKPQKKLNEWEKQKWLTVLALRVKIAMLIAEEEIVRSQIDPARLKKIRKGDIITIPASNKEYVVKRNIRGRK